MGGYGTPQNVSVIIYEQPLVEEDESSENLSFEIIANSYSSDSSDSRQDQACVKEKKEEDFCHMSGVTCQVQGIRCQVSHVMCQVLHVMCPMSCVKCPVSLVVCHA